MELGHISAPVQRLLAATDESSAHLVGFYERDGFLAHTVAAFLLPALEAGQGAIAIATPGHRELIEHALVRRGVDVAAAAGRDDLVMLDAVETLDRVIVDGRPDQARVQALLSSVSARVGSHGRGLRVFGELSALLWQGGDLQAASELEQLTHTARGTGSCRVLCMYPACTVASEEQTLAFLTICEHHTGVIPGDDYSTLPDVESRFRRVALLQQEVIALRGQRREDDRQPGRPGRLATSSSYDVLDHPPLYAPSGTLHGSIAAGEALLDELRQVVAGQVPGAERLMDELDQHYGELRELVEGSGRWPTVRTPPVQANRTMR